MAAQATSSAASTRIPVPAQDHHKTTATSPTHAAARHKPNTSYRAGRRLGVDPMGELTYKKTPSSTLMASLQLGLQHSIGSLEPKARRDILMTDFEVVETVDFPSGGSGCTPGHNYSDFTFKTYSPVAFRFFREAFKIAAEDYLIALCDLPLRELSNSGASGSLFYLSADDAFIMKTVTKKEGLFLQKLLPGYYLNLTQNKKTLLPKFFGLYRYKCGTTNIRIVVMNNLLPSSLRYHEKYDLKGSTYKRRANDRELGKVSPTFKDLDYKERHIEGIILSPEKHEILLKTLDRDCKVLESFGIMDYSLLLGVYNVDEAAREREDFLATLDQSTLGPNTSEAMKVLMEGDKPVPSRIELSKNFSIISVDEQPHTKPQDELPQQYPEGYIQGRLHDDRVLVYLGVIDILQSYRFRKKLEHTVKAVITDGKTVSVTNPSFYARRFQDFVSGSVFKKEKVKFKTRKNSQNAYRNRKQSGLRVSTSAVPRPSLTKQSSVTKDTAESPHSAATTHLIVGASPHSHPHSHPPTSTSHHTSSSSSSSPNKSHNNTSTSTIPVPHKEVSFNLPPSFERKELALASEEDTSSGHHPQQQHLPEIPSIKVLSSTPSDKGFIHNKPPAPEGMHAHPPPADHSPPAVPSQMGSGGHKPLLPQLQQQQQHANDDYKGGESDSSRPQDKPLYEEEEEEEERNGGGKGVESYLMAANVPLSKGGEGREEEEGGGGQEELLDTDTIMVDFASEHAVATSTPINEHSPDASSPQSRGHGAVGGGGVVAMTIVSPDNTTATNNNNNSNATDNAATTSSSNSEFISSGSANPAVSTSILTFEDKSDGNAIAAKSSDNSSASTAGGVAYHQHPSNTSRNAEDEVTDSSLSNEAECVVSGGSKQSGSNVPGQAGNSVGVEGLGVGELDTTGQNTSTQMEEHYL